MSVPVTITGRLGADPELTFANSGMAITKMRVVTDRRVKDGDEWKSIDTSWHYVTAFGPCAEGAAEELRKGDLVILQGTLKQREYETKEGEKRSKLKVVLDNFQFVGSRGDGGGDSSGAEDSAPPPRTASRGNSGGAKTASVDEEDVPF